MDDILDGPIIQVARALRRGDVSAIEVTEASLRRQALGEHRFHAYKHVDPEGARAAARAADEVLAGGDDPPPLCGIPISVKDLYGAQGLPTYAGTARRLPDSWEHDGWLVARLRAQGAVVIGKTHTVELAYGAVGINPHWGTPRNPWDPQEHRIPGGSSCGAGVSLWEGSALLALGSDTGGSIRIPASMTGVVGHKTTKGRWPTTGVVPLSSTLDTVGALARSVADSVYFFGAVDPAWGDAEAFVTHLAEQTLGGLRVAVPRSGIWDDCQPDIADVIHDALSELGPSFTLTEVDGGLLDEAGHLYMHGGIAGAECRAFLREELPGWLDILHPTVGSRLALAPSMDSREYVESLARRGELVWRAGSLFADADLLALPSAILTPPRVDDLHAHQAYLDTNAAALRPTCPVSMLGLCAISIPVGLDRAGMPVGLQLVAPAGADGQLLGAALAVEEILGTPRARLGTPG